ncbi:MAG: NUDIX hydrolase [Dehalococcoidales bacterium]|nr:NUDIX hydrolase [Dehalococcoidales bacterium]
MAEEKTVSSRRIFEGRAFNVRIDTVITASGRESTREIVEHTACIAVIVQDSNGDILLVRQYRKALEKELLEIPAGGIDPGEDPETAVRRELQEETGYLPGRVERLGGFYSSPGFCTEYLYLYQAFDLKPSRLYAEDTPGIETVRIKPQQILDMIATEQICDSKSVAGLLYFLASRGDAPKP